LGGAMSDGPPPRCRVLVVEDDRISRTALVQLLSIMGYEPCAAATVAEGLARLDGQQALLLDLNLPDGLGTAILEKVRSERRPIRVAVITASFDEWLMADVDKLKPDAIFRKPLDVGALREWLRAVTAP
jgi:two-component system response regulator TctD